MHVNRERLGPLQLDARDMVRRAQAAVKRAPGLTGSARKPEPRAVRPPPAQVPAGFDASQVPGLDASTAKGVEETAPLVFLCRWLELHGQVGPLQTASPAWWDQAGLEPPQGAVPSRTAVTLRLPQKHAEACTALCRRASMQLHGQGLQDYLAAH